MKYYEEVRGFEEDGLLAERQIATIVHNVKVLAPVVRGQLVCKDENGWSPVTENADAQKALGIVASTFAPDETHKVTQIYVSGVFSKEKVLIGANPPVSIARLDEVEVLIGEALDYSTFEEALRKSGIYLTGVIA